jgi:hypothetical protein
MRNVRLSAVVALALIGAVVLAGFATAGEINKNAGTSAFPFLKINVGARPVAERYALGLHLDYLNYGDFVQTDNLGTVTGSFGGGDLLLAVTLAKRQREDLMFGITGKIIYEKIQDYSATGLAVDLGVKYTRNRGRNSFGLMVQNLGTQLSALGTEKDRLPLTLRAGAAVQPKGLPLLIASDVLIPVDNKIVFAVGGEYIALKPLFLRLGWNSFGSNFRASGSDDKWAGLSFGAGFEIKQGMQLSYSYSPAADLGESHRITLAGSAKW